MLQRQETDTRNNYVGANVMSFNGRVESRYEAVAEMKKFAQKRYIPEPDSTELEKPYVYSITSLLSFLGLFLSFLINKQLVHAKGCSHSIRTPMRDELASSV